MKQGNRFYFISLLAGGCLVAAVTAAPADAFCVPVVGSCTETTEEITNENYNYTTNRNTNTVIGNVGRDRIQTGAVEQGKAIDTLVGGPVVAAPEINLPELDELNFGNQATIQGDNAGIVSQGQQGNIFSFGGSTLIGNEIGNNNGVIGHSYSFGSDGNANAANIQPSIGGSPASTASGSGSQDADSTASNTPNVEVQNAKAPTLGNKASAVSPGSGSGLLRSIRSLR